MCWGHMYKNYFVFKISGGECHLKIFFLFYAFEAIMSMERNCSIFYSDGPVVSGTEQFKVL